jgi:hypothetical protein
MSGTRYVDLMTDDLDRDADYERIVAMLEEACTSSLWRDRSKPTYNMSWASWCWLLRQPDVVTSEAPSHGIR